MSKPESIYIELILRFKMWHLTGYESDNFYAVSESCASHQITLHVAHRVRVIFVQFQFTFTRDGGVTLVKFRDVPVMGDPFYVANDGTVTKLHSIVHLFPIRGREHTFQ